jgi:hypothetical protein
MICRQQKCLSGFEVEGRMDAFESTRASPCLASASTTELRGHQAMDSLALVLPEGGGTSLPNTTTASGSKPKSKKGKVKEPGAAPKKRRKSEKAASGVGESEGGEDGSQSGSILSGQASLGVGGDSGGNTPTKRKASGKPSRAKGIAQRSITRQDSRGGSRGTSARASTSIAPGQAQQDGEEEEAEPSVQATEEDEEIEDDDEDEEGNGPSQGLEEDEWQRQEAIQKARATAMAPLMKAMDETQLDRYYAYRGTFLDKRHVKRVSIFLVFLS